jgi:hypothetical protein
MYWTLRCTWFEAVHGLQFFTMRQRYTLVVRQHSLTAERAVAERAVAERAVAEPAVAERAVAEPAVAVVVAEPVSLKKALLFGFGIVYCLYDIMYTRSPA